MLTLNRLFLLYGVAASTEDAARFRRLRQLAAEKKDHERELDFFAMELKAKRFHETRTLGGVLINFVYQYFSDFGRSVRRPVSVLLLLWIIAAGLIAAQYTTSASDLVNKVMPSIDMAITNSAVLLGSDRWSIRAQALEQLCGNCRTLGPLGERAAIIQSGVSLLLLFFAGLALRNRFRIGGNG